MQAIQISIPEPCHESWQQMTPTAKGRFCKACAKEVVDFSKMTDSEVLNYFTEKATANVCGRVLPEQLNRNITKPVTITQKVTWYWKYLVATVLLFAKTPAKAQKDRINGGLVRQTPQSCTPVKGKMALPRTINDTPVNEIYKGKVLNENGEALPGATIQLKGTNRGAIADAGGNFTILIHKDSSKIIEVSYVGYQSKEVLLSSINKNNNIVTLAVSIFLGGDIVITYINKSPEQFAQINILDKKSKDAISNAFITIQKNSQEFKKVYTNAEGIVELENISNINEDDSYLVKISAGGYQNYETEISGEEFLNNNPLSKMYLTANKISANKINIIKATPNPISKGSSFTVTLKLLETGKYILQIINTEGNVVLNKYVQASSKNFTAALMAASDWSSGIYFIKLINSENNMLAQDSFVIQ
ncbi:MAG: carboxypeptidase-like regulatory domain-containing protein [Chitinophagaceae bacterium]|nr:carboxypeptidase-like regulatory domain-containing protein [Chitinophagaceae bacterium]